MNRIHHRAAAGRIARCLAALLLAMPIALQAQGRLYEGPDDPAGDPAAEREVHMDGNRFQIYLNTGGYTGHWGYLDGSKWPRNSQQGLDLYDGCWLIVGSKVFLENDTVPVTGAAAIASRTDLDSLFIIESDSQSETAPDGTISWSFNPVFGYFNEVSETPAISIDPKSWPPAGWPSRGDELKWPGEWNGRFGRGVQYAQLETYFVMNDAQDQEWLQPDKPVRYAPRRALDGQGAVVRDVRIGDKRPDVTTQKGLPWGGLGVRVEVRGYQWDNPQTRDIVFWEYNIANISEYDLPAMVFGYQMDLGIGHYILRSDGEDDVGSFNKELDLSFCWDINGIGNFGYPVGTFGFAFLESPGVSNDGIDNDSDGSVDEKRDNMAVHKVGPTEDIADLAKFLESNGIKGPEDLREHWDADEDQDWRDGEDLNGNGAYDSGEKPGDDVGLDGVGPGELNYFGPDLDGTECNHKPDQLEGLGAEPNFGYTDVNESDMLGLQTFHLYQHPQGAAPSPRWDKECYAILSDHLLDDNYDQPNNLYQSFGTGPFRLDKGRTERISMATIAAYEDLATLNNEKRAPIVFDRKKVVQLIYASDYRFAKPPEMPTLKAIPADGKVVLTWDDRADRFTREPLAGGENDFEGYKLYRSTDRFFEDALQLRDGFGNPAGLKPLKQWDLKNDIFGHTDFALVEGEGFYLGSNTGIVHHYVDEAVQNGRTYYYFLAAYDRGMRDRNIAPAENVYTIAVDENEAITFMGPNVQVVTPKTRAAGYADPTVETVHDPSAIDGPADSVFVSVADPLSLRPGREYRMVFDVDTVKTATYRKPLTAPWGVKFVNTGFRIFDASNDSVVFSEDTTRSILNHLTIFETGGATYGENLRWKLLRTGERITTDIFDGLQVSLSLPLGKDGVAYFDSINTGWFSGGGLMTVQPYRLNMAFYPWKFDLVFADGPAYTSLVTRRQRADINTGKALKSKQYLLGTTFPFYVLDRSHRGPDGEYLKLDLVAIDLNDNEQFELFEDAVYAGYVDYDAAKEQYTWQNSIFSFHFQGGSEETIPQPGSVYRFEFMRPFATTDTLAFRVPPYRLDAGPLVDENMDRIDVVPNPYIVTNTLEPAVRNNQLNQRRRVMFTHLPARCTIQIFTMSGYLVDTVEVDQNQDNGTATWDLLTREDLEIAAGVYLYHVKSKATGREKAGKFAVIK